MAAEDASLLVSGREPAEQAEISTSVLTVVLMATVTVAVVRHWASVEVAAVSALVMVARSPVEAALRERESCPSMCSEFLDCLRSHLSRSTHPQVEHRPCSRSSTPFESVAVYI